MRLFWILVAVAVMILPAANTYETLGSMINTNPMIILEESDSNIALKPDLVVGDSWTYHVTTLDFEIEVDIITVHISDGEIDNLDVVVDEVQSENYKMTFESTDVTGWVGGVPLWWGWLDQTTFDGVMYIRKSDLAIMGSMIHMEGYIKKPIGTKKWFELDIELDITDGYDSYHFPIVCGESWVVDTTYISMYSSFYLEGLYDLDKTRYSYIDGHTSTCTGIVTESVEAGSFEAFHIESGLGSSSESYYAPAAFGTIEILAENLQDGNNIFKLNEVESELKSLSLQNHKPYSPDVPSGSQSGYRYVSYTYSTSAIDPDGDQVRYKFDWGDGTQSTWTNLVNSGQSASKSYSWNDIGTFFVRAKTKDEHGLESEDWSGVLIVMIQNRQPIANDDMATVNKGSSDNEINVLANDDDPDGDTVEITGVSDPPHGTATYTLDYVYYTPDSNYYGTDSFTYSISDGHDGEDVAFVTITITNMNTPPVAYDDYYTTVENNDLVVPAPGILDNDIDNDGDLLYSIKVSGPSHGVLTEFNNDGSFSYSPNLNFNGVDSFTYKANDGLADSNIATVTITVNPVGLPVANAHGPYSGTVDEAVHFTGSASGGTSPYSYYWDFGDGGHSNIQSPTHVYTATGTYDVTFTVTDSNSNSDTDETTATISETPPLVAEAGGPYTGNIYNPVKFTGSASGGTSPYSYYWDFGDGGSGTGQSPSHQYNAMGTYDVTLTVTDDVGNSDTDETIVTIIEYEGPVANAYGPYSGTVDEVVHFTGSASGGTSPYSYYWDFGDGGSSTKQSPWHVYNAVGTYDVTLIVTDDVGNTGTDYAIVAVYYPRDILDQQQIQYCGWCFGITGAGMLAQSFKPTLKTLTKVELYMYQKGSPTGLKISIRSSLSGEDLTSVTVSDGLQKYPTPKWMEFDFPDINVVTGKSYYIVWDPIGAYEDNTFYWGLGDDNPYYRGDPYYFNGKHWYQYKPSLDRDSCFRTYGRDNHPPDKPTIDGPTSGKIGIEYTFSSSTIDPDPDIVRYGWDFNGDTIVDEWTDYCGSGVPVTTFYTWDIKGTYQIRVKAQDIVGEESEWSDSLTVTLEGKGRSVNVPNFFNFLQRFIDQFPVLARLFDLL